MTSKNDWKAKWIWLAGRPATELNIYAYFRKTFEMDSVPQSAVCAISADSRYTLYVNGEFVCRGVPVCDPLYQYYDEPDIAKYLKPGKNSIAVLVHHFGTNNSKYMTGGRAGFLFECKTGDGYIATDSSWKSTLCEAYRQDVPRICATHMIQGFQEHFDSRKEPDGWHTTDFDDSAWHESVEIPGGYDSTAPIDPWPSMVPRDFPLYFEEERKAAEVVRVGEVEDVKINDRNDLSDKMQREPLQPISKVVLHNIENALTFTDDYAIISQDDSEMSKCPSIIVDMGKEVTGMPRIVVDAPEGAVIDIAMAEMQTKDGINHYWGNLIGMGVAHRFIARGGVQAFETYLRFGYRYLQVTFRNLTKPLKLYRTSVNFTSYDVGSRGRFSCSDDYLNKLWERAAYTAQLCMYDAWEDCPGREQRQWVGDARVEALIAYACFGDLALSRKFLVQTGQSQRPDGMTMCLYPGCTGIINHTIVDYNLHWLCAIWEYYMHSGDSELVQSLLPKVKLSVSYWEKHKNDKGLLAHVPSHVYLDACVLAIERKEMITVLNCFYISVLEYVAQMASLCDEKDYEKWCLATADEMKKAVHAELFDTSEGIYADSADENGLSERRNMHSNIMPLLYGVTPKDNRDSVWDYILNDDYFARIRKHVEEGRTAGAPQPFFSYFLFELLATNDKIDHLLYLARKHWQQMTEADHGTLWEIWEDVRAYVDEPGTQNSLCHAWAGTPAYHMSSDILGVRPTSAGFSSFDISPKPTGLAWAKGVFPSVKGDIPVDWKDSETTFEVEFTVPGNTTARLVLPFSSVKKLTINGDSPTTGITDSGSICLEGLNPGSYSVSVEK